ncbi:MAG: hypothetical protein WC718_04360 [Phycisphaerales bacterium]
MADNEWDVWAALFEVAKADTGAGGLVALSGKTDPLLRWGDRGMNSLPVIVGFFPTGTPTKGPKDALVLGLQLDFYTETNSAGLAWDMADRMETVFTNTNMASTARTNPVDVIPYLRARRDMPELDEGRIRVTQEWNVRFNR